MTQGTQDASQAVDWAAAVRSGQRLAPRGPAVTAAEARGAVADLRRLSREAESRVRDATGLGLGLPLAEAEVVDRRGWVSAAAEGMAELSKPLTDALVPADYRGPGVGSQLGIVLAYLSARVLGQYDPVGGGATGTGGRLLLVAPNVIHAEREIQADPADFRLWVCLHESTHRLQFTAVPWMVGHFRSLVEDYAAVAPNDAGEFLKRAAAALRGRSEDPEQTFLRRVQTADQQQVFDRLMALMTLLEGHADFVMDAVGPAVVPSVESIRAAFTKRRAKRRGPLERLLRSLLGMDAKMAQYARGAAFARAVVDRVGMTGFNAVFAGPASLPTLAEIGAPEDWISRVHGGAVEREGESPADPAPPAAGDAAR